MRHATKDKIVAFQKPDHAKDLLTVLLRYGEQKLIVETVKAEIEAFSSNYESAADAYALAAVVQNDHRQQRHVLTVIRSVLATGALALRIGLSVQKYWCRLRGFEQFAKVIAGVRVRDGIELQERNTCKRIQAFSRAAA